MTRAARSAVLLLAVTALSALGLVALERARASTASWSVAGWWAPAVVAAGEPVVAFVDATCADCSRPLVQLRVCPAEGAGRCDVAARIAPSASGPTRVRYARRLAPGGYAADVLLLDVDRWGAVRTREVLSATVEVR